jgi:polyhydroxybutyrate depolymerase
MKSRRRGRWARRFALGVCLCALALAALTLVFPGWSTIEDALATPVAILAAAIGVTPFAPVVSRDAPVGSESGLHQVNALVSTGCGNASAVAPGTTGVERLRVGALTRSYRLHVPRAYQPTIKTALVLSFHGHNSAAALYEQRTGLSSLADAHHFIAVYPQGVIGPDGLTGWNTGRAKDPTVDDLRFVDQLLISLQQSLCVDPQRIYATGFSNGGGFADALACAFSARIAAFAPVAGDYFPQPDGCHPIHPVSLLEIHGTADVINPYDGSVKLHYPSVATWLAQWAQRDSCPATPSVSPGASGVTIETWSGCAEGSVILHYQVTGGAHIWPDAALAGEIPTAAATVDSQFATSALIWSFFAQTTLTMRQGASA